METVEKEADDVKELDESAFNELSKEEQKKVIENTIIANMTEEEKAELALAIKAKTTRKIKDKIARNWYGGKGNRKQRRDIDKMYRKKDDTRISDAKKKQIKKAKKKASKLAKRMSRSK